MLSRGVRLLYREIMNQVPHPYLKSGGSWDADAISPVEIANTILRNWHVVALLPLAFALVAGVWTLTQSRTYAATATFMPQAAEGRRSSAASAVAQQFGVSLGSERPAQSPQFYVDLLQSLTILRDAVESEYDLPMENGTVRSATLVEIFEIEEPDEIPTWRRAVRMLRENLSTSVNRETGVVRLTVTASHPALGEQVAERLLGLLNEFNLEVRQGRAQEEGRFFAGRVREAQAELLAAERLLQDFLRQNREFRNSPELAFEHDRLQRQVAMRQDVYTSLLRSQEEVRIDAVRDTPLLTVIDQPAGSAEPEGRGMILRVLLAFILGLFIALFIAFAREFTRRSREINDPEYREFKWLARQAWNEIRRPQKWLQRGEDPVVTDGK